MCLQAPARKPPRRCRERQRIARRPPERWSSVRAEPCTRTTRATRRSPTQWMSRCSRLSRMVGPEHLMAGTLQVNVVPAATVSPAERPCCHFGRRHQAGSGTGEPQQMPQSGLEEPSAWVALRGSTPRSPHTEASAPRQHGRNCLRKSGQPHSMQRSFEVPQKRHWLEEHSKVRLRVRSIEKQWCGWSESNRHSLRNRILSPARLPIPPHPHRAALHPWVLAQIELAVEPRFPICRHAVSTSLFDATRRSVSERTRRCRFMRLSSRHPCSRHTNQHRLRA